MKNDFFAGLGEFRRQFILTGFDRLRKMEAAIDRLTALQGSDEALWELSRHFHGLAGSGGTYGFAVVSGVAAEGEASCGAALERHCPPTADELAQWRALLSSIQAALESGGDGT